MGIRRTINNQASFSGNKRIYDRNLVMNKRENNMRNICRLIIWIFSITMFTLYGLPFIERILLCSLSPNPFN